MNKSLALVSAGEGGGQIARLDQLRHAEDQLDLSGTVNFLGRWWRLILATMASVIVAVFIISLVIAPTYRAEATVVVDKSAENADRASPTPAGRAVVSNELIETQVAIITSREMTERVVDALGLAQGQPKEARQEIEEQVREHVDASRSGESYALKIEFLDEDPGTAAATSSPDNIQIGNWVKPKSAIKERLRWCRTVWLLCEIRPNKIRRCFSNIASTTIF